MRLLSGLALLAVIAAGIAFYLGWFNIQWNDEKIQSDIDTAKQKLEEFRRNADGTPVDPNAPPEQQF
jgi:hypothetical protein